MTFRSVIFGLLGAAFIAAFAYISNEIFHLSPFISNFLPVSVFGFFVVFAMVVNPLLYRIRPRLRLAPRELAVALVLMCVSCSVPTFGLMTTFAPAVVMPVQYERVMPGWQKHHALQYAPPSMLIANGKYDTKAVGGWLSGLGYNGENIGLADIPWEQWRGPLVAWLPLILLFAIGIISLSLVVHRQWSSHERLRYPIAEFATALLSQDEAGGGSRAVGGRAGGAIPALFRNRLFLTGFAVISIIHLVNGLQAWYPDSISIQMQFYFGAFNEKWPNNALASYLAYVRLFPTAIAFSFFLASDVGLSLGLAQIFYSVIFMLLLQAGVNPRTNFMSGGGFSWEIFGGYVGMAMFMLYTGRRYYWQVLRGALGLPRGENVERFAVWACRIFFLALAAETVWLARVGMDWPIALLAMLLSVLIFLGISRIVAETGLFWCQAYWYPSGVLMGLFGAEALGPSAIAILCLLNAVLTVNPREALMPYFINGLKICEDQSIRPGRVGWSAMGVFCLALAVAVPVVLWANYNYGVQISWNSWSNEFIPRSAFDTVARAATELSVSGKLEESVGYSAWERLTHIRPDPAFLCWAGAGLVLVPIFAFLRLRWNWWPLHPVIFLVWGDNPINTMGSSFLVGWLVKVAVTKVGGPRTHRKAKSFMIGVIAGELFCGLLFMLIAVAYRMATGQSPPEYVVLP